MNIEYKINTPIAPEDIISLYESAGLNRPTNDKERIEKMYKNSNLVISAWDENTLVGVSRALTDFCFCCYLSDLAVRKEYQKQGIGKKLIDATREHISSQSMLLLLSAPTAMEYYPAIGMDEVKNGFIFNRLQ